MLLNTDRISAQLKRFKVLDKIGELKILSSIDSTNDYLARKKGPKNFSFCLAEEQTKGKGRLGRTWFSPYGKNIYLSCLWLPKKKINTLDGLALVPAIAAVTALEKSKVSEIKIKWPNDLMVKKKKLAGILIENNIRKNSVIIGIGINVNMKKISQQKIGQPWTSLQKISNKLFDRNHIAALLIKELIVSLKKLEQSGWKYFEKIYNKKHD
jgi:BirA family transcriptional regulator, biotin operon repressor / biotin---[acetyl-CoA-carboxylase] ligase